MDYCLGTTGLYSFNRTSYVYEYYYIDQIDTDIGAYSLVSCSSLRQDCLRININIARNEIVENRENYMSKWDEKIQYGNARERLKAKQMIELTEEGKTNKVYPEMVNLVLECVGVKGKENVVLSRLI